MGSPDCVGLVATRGRLLNLALWQPFSWTAIAGLVSVLTVARHSTRQAIETQSTLHCILLPSVKRDHEPDQTMATASITNFTNSLNFEI